MKESNENRRKEEMKRERNSYGAKINKDLFFSVNGCNQSVECDTREMERVISKNERERLKRAGRERERGDGMLFRELAGIRIHFNSIGALILL